MKLIDADALVEALAIAYQMTLDEKIKYAIFSVQTAPAIDAVPVVRCKDCTRWEPMEYLPIGGGWCKQLGESTDGNFYCQQGERMEDENGE